MLNKKVNIVFFIGALLIAITSFWGAIQIFNVDFINTLDIRGNIIEIQASGIYAYNISSLFIEGVGWDIARLLLLPLLIISYLKYRKGSIKWTVILFGLLVNFIYQYFLWALTWAYNDLFLMYCLLVPILAIVLFDVLKFVLQNLSLNHINPFPYIKLANFSLTLSVLIGILWLSEIVPSITSGNLPLKFTGVNTLVVQAIDITVILPVAIFTFTALRKQKRIGVILSPIIIITFLSLSTAIIAGTVLSGLIVGGLDIVGLIIFILIAALDVYFLKRLLLSIKSTVV